MNFLTILTTILSLFLALPGGEALAANSRDYRKTGVTVVHVRDAHPFFFVGRNDTPRGMLVDLWKAWSAKTGVPVEFAFASWKNSLSMVLDGTYDIHGGLMISPDRVDEFGFGPPLFTIATSLITREDENRDVGSILEHETVGIVTAGLPGKILLARFLDVKVKRFDLPRQAVEAMADGRVDAVAMDEPTFHFNNIELPNPVDYKSLVVLSEKEIHAGVLKDNVELLHLINEGFASIDGKELKSIQKRWFVVSSKPETTNYALWIGAATLLLVISLLTAWKGHYSPPSE